MITLKIENDGESNMSGHIKGVAARIRSEIRRALYIHYICNRLNSSLQTAFSEILEVRKWVWVEFIYSVIENIIKSK